MKMWFPSFVTLLAEPLIKYLHQLKAQGETHVHVDDDAKLLLREFYKRAANGGVAAPVGVKKETPNPAKSSKAELKLTITGNSVEEKLASLKAQAKTWASIKALGELRETMVFSGGNLQADIMVIGEAPGYDEERTQVPFAGPAGQKFDAILKAMGTSRKEVYASYIVKFRPKMANQTTTNRKLSVEEMSVWLPMINEEINMIKPKVIIALGVMSAKVLLGLNESVEQLRGKFHDYEGVPLRVTYHPSYILNNEVTPEKRMLWEDLLGVMELLGLPISEKQRGYFK